MNHPSNGQPATDPVDGLVVQLQGLIGGLINQEDLPPTRGLQSGYAETGMSPGSCENALVPTHCLRTVSQRSLSAPVNFLGSPVHIPAGTDVFAALVTAPGTGCLPGVGTGGTAPIVFHDANVQAQRQRVDELVLWGARAELSVQAQAGLGGAVPFNQGEYVNSVRDFMLDYIVFRVFHTSDRNEPWVDSTPLRYLHRKPGNFLAMPPVLWKDRDPRMELDVRVADFGAAAGALPTVQLGSIDIDAQASILFETLWIPNPDYCGSYWPGTICPKKHVANMPGYVGK